MTPLIATIISLSIVFGSTVLGSAIVFFFKKNFKDRTNNTLLGFASGIMIAAAFFGLLIPAIEEAKINYEDLALLPVLIGFFIGATLLYVLDKVIPHFHASSEEEEGPKSALSKNLKFLLSVTMHNIPEGLAVGFALGLAIEAKTDTAIFAALILSTGIAIQNIPEGMAISVPLFASGMSKFKSFLFGCISGVVEPLFALLGIVLASNIAFLMPWLLAFAAGAMIYVTIDELLPAARKGDKFLHYGIWAFMIGFAIMMVLEIVLGH